MCWLKAWESERKLEAENMWEARKKIGGWKVVGDQNGVGGQQEK